MPVIAICSDEMDRAAALRRSSDSSLNSFGDNPRWDNTMHVNAGNMVLADGSAHQFTQTGLAQQMGSTDGDPNCSLKPN